MTFTQAIVLGLVQGITEFLPISSSGHLIAIPHIFGWAEQGMDFDVMIHLATLLAILLVLRKDVLSAVRGVFLPKEKNTVGMKIIIATIPVVIAGVVIESSFLDTIRTVQVVAVQLIVWGVILAVADRYGAKKATRTSDVIQTSSKQAILMGLFQVMALVPGSSRSGVTIGAGLFAGMDRKTAERFSFLLAIPAIAGAGLLTLIDAFEHGFTTPVVPMVIGFVAAFVSGSLAITFLLQLLEKTNYYWFAGYRILLGVLLLVFLR